MRGRGGHVEGVQTDAATTVDVWVVDWRDETNFGRLERVPVRDLARDPLAQGGGVAARCAEHRIPRPAIERTVISSLKVPPSYGVPAGPCITVAGANR